MEIKGYHEQKKEQVQVAKTGLGVIKAVRDDNLPNPLISADDLQTINKREEKFQRILENPKQAADQKALEISNMVAQIKEVGLSPQNPAVVNWAEQELGVSANEFGKLLRNSETPQEAQNNVLELMEAPKELIDTSIKNSSVKKKV